MTYTSAQRKGWEHENKIKKQLLELGRCDRSPMSGSYTGECDLKWLIANRFWEIDCKYGKAWTMKRHRDRLEKSDICIDNSAREVPLVIMPLPKLLELLGVSPLVGEG